MTSTQSPPRLVVLTASTVAVYEGRKLIAFSKEPFAYTASEVEEMRTAVYHQEKSA